MSGLKTRMRDDGTVMVQTAPGRWTAKAYYDAHRDQFLPAGESAGARPTTARNAAEGGGHVAAPSHRSGQPGSISDISQAPQRAARDAVAAARSCPKVVRPAAQFAAPAQLTSAQKREIVINLYGATDLLQSAIAKRARAPKGSVSGWLSMARAAGDARVKAGDKRRGRG